MADDKNGGPMPMYVSYSTFVTFLDWIKAMPVTPSQIDRSLWSGKFGGGNGAQLMVGLRFLGLLRGEEPTDVLEELARANNERRKEILADVLRNAYGQELIDQLPRMTPSLLNKALDELGSTEATRRKAFSFLINAARFAELPIGSGIAKKARNRRARAAGMPKTTGKTRQGEGDGTKQKHEPAADGENKRTVKLGSGGHVTLTLSVDLFELSAYDRTFLLDLIDRLTSYVAEPDSADVGTQSKPGGTAGGNDREAPGSQSLPATPGASEGGSRED